LEHFKNFNLAFLIAEKLQCKKLPISHSDTLTTVPEPLTEEIRLKIFGSPDLPDFGVDILSDRDSVYSPENLFDILGTPEHMFLICTGTLMKICWKFWLS